MRLQSLIIGIAITVILLAMLVATRMMVLTAKAPEFEVREVETVELPEPPPPVPEEQEEEETPPPPPPALANVSTAVDLSRPALSVSPLKIDPQLAVDTFFSDLPPAPLPRPRRPINHPKGNAKKSPSITHKVSRPRVKHIPPPKSQYSIGELDQRPRLLSHPSVRFPRTIHNAKRGKVVVRVAIFPSGRSRFISLISTTHPALVPLARRIANRSRFSPPTRHGKAVKAVMSWPIIIKK